MKAIILNDAEARLLTMTGRAVVWRPVKFDPHNQGLDGYDYVTDNRIVRQPWSKEAIAKYCRRFFPEPGGQMWVRETWGIDPLYRPGRQNGHMKFLFRAKTNIDPDYPIKWRSPVTMPLSLSRYVVTCGETDAVKQLDGVWFWVCEVRI